MSTTPGLINDNTPLHLLRNTCYVPLLPLRGAKIGQNPGLAVRRWSAIRVAADGKTEELGRMAGEDAIPMALRRRMGRLERFAVRCALAVLDDEPTGELIFCSRCGNVETLSALHRGIASGQLMSPMAFSGSVHNATPGLVGQIRDERLSHTAIAAGSHTFAAGLVEAYARLLLEECRDVTVIFADLLLPEVYSAFEAEADAGVAVAVRVECADDIDGVPAAAVKPGRAGVLAMVDKLREGASRISLEGLPWAMQGN